MSWMKKLEKQELLSTFAKSVEDGNTQSPETVWFYPRCLIQNLKVKTVSAFLAQSVHNTREIFNKTDQRNLISRYSLTNANLSGLD